MMLDEQKIFNVIENFINEVSYTIPAKKKSEHPIIVILRSKAGGGGQAGSSSAHSCSIKVKVGSGKQTTGYPLIVPNIPFSQFKIDAKKIGSKEYLKDHISDNESYAAIIGFVYDNQMAIIAYWNAIGGERGKVGKELEMFIKAKLSNNNYHDKKFSVPKNQNELNADKEEIIAYVRKQLKDDTISIDFGS